jgi:bacterioferritin (cytochrome b1)
VLPVCNDGAGTKMQSRTECHDNQRFVERYIFLAENPCWANGCGQIGSNCGSLRERSRTQKEKKMSEDMKAELQHWQARTDEMQVAIERVREERDSLRAENALLSKAVVHADAEIKQLRSMLERVQIALSQGVEL